MAKKVLTPEEVKAKMEKKSAKRKLFFGTFTKALAFFLAIAMAYSLATIAFTPVTAPAGTAVQGSQQSGGESVDEGGEDDFGDAFGGGDSSTPSGDSSTPSGDSSTPSGDSSTPSGDSSTPSGDSKPSGTTKPTGDVKKTVAEAMNAATAKAAKGNYEMERVCKYQEGKGIKVTMLGGDATSVLNGVITGVDKNASLDSVVGGFLGVGTKKIKVTNGVGQRYGSDGTMAELTNEEKDYMLKAMNLSAGDISNAKIEGNVYTFALAKIADPQKDGNNAMHKATNDFITEEQVKTAIGSLTSAITVESANVSYNSILFVATIEDGNLKNLKMSYKADAKMKLKVGMAIDGSGSMVVNTTYTF